MADDSEFVGRFHHFHLNAVEVSRTKNNLDQVNSWKFLEQKNNLDLDWKFLEQKYVNQVDVKIGLT